MIQIINHTPNPISHIGKIAGICWNGNIEDQQKNFKRGLECIENNHGRVMEYADIEAVIDEYSARVIREWYTQKIGTTNLQESTRYVDCATFGYYTPSSIQSDSHRKKVYDNCMDLIKVTYEQLLQLGVPKEDVANILPLGMNTKIVCKINLRAIIHMFETRECTRAYKEYRKLMSELKQALSKLDDEWKLLCEREFVAKCERLNYCNEKYSCGRYPKQNK